MEANLIKYKSIERKGKVLTNTLNFILTIPVIESDFSRQTAKLAQQIRNSIIEGVSYLYFVNNRIVKK